MDSTFQNYFLINEDAFNTSCLVIRSSKVVKTAQRATKGRISLC